MLPTEESFNRSHVAALIDDGLVMQTELLTLKGNRQLATKFPIGGKGSGRRHIAGNPQAIATVPLGLEQCGVGSRQKVPAGQSLGRPHHTNTAGQADHTAG